MEIEVDQLGIEHIGAFYRYTYTVDQGKGEITLVNQGMLEIRDVHHNLDGSVTITHKTGPQTFSAGTEVFLYTDHLPTAND